MLSFRLVVGLIRAGFAKYSSSRRIKFYCKHCGIYSATKLINQTLSKHTTVLSRLFSCILILEKRNWRQIAPLEMFSHFIQEFPVLAIFECCQPGRYNTSPRVELPKWFICSSLRPKNNICPINKSLHTWHPRFRWKSNNNKKVAINATPLGVSVDWGRLLCTVLICSCGNHRNVQQ